MGQKKTLWVPTPEQEARIREMAALGHSCTGIAQKIKVSNPPLKRWLKVNGVAITWVRPKNKATQGIAIIPCEIRNSDEGDPNWISPAKRFRHL